MNLHTDGGARGNPGPAAAGAVLSTEDGKLVATSKEYLGETTNNIAEYKALLIGLSLAKENSATDLICYLDSELIVKQLNGEYRVKKDTLKELFAKVKVAANQFSSIKFVHVKREFNKDADKLVNEVLDAQTSA